ncbi:sulfurtransferase TusA family protein [Brevibacillus agri]|uniref:sulfurtransferase TusA family protein n=1 Tax=Brevibacillus agri TaxID=51101 RepID=UPI002E1FFEFE|nr:sulfurtransferase TusA family protein [Brevibacillus agri]MED1654964.1 sulfurtransferase TusA family protein [Brevibacillus agri]MED1685884.1 sulfurtransferase TusA family protein [Brevibacillus agri]MED1694065.1 sulfurtransferase TusA family protein [Brevibacillus agri]MED1699777.1 sulfurtransferase TusA family protein [Brevibacillus agri]
MSAQARPNFSVDKVLDCKGLACPMPVVRTKKAMEQIAPGQVIEVQATDKGSLSDMKGWANNTGHHYLGSIQEGDVMRHFLRKASPQETKAERKYPYTITNEELQARLQSPEPFLLIDVREPAEYAFQRIPAAKSIPLGVLEQHLDELPTDRDMFVICRSGNRSDLACQLLAGKGFSRVKNVVPGMAGWGGPVENQ